MVEVVGEGARNSRTFGITAAGREELRRWLVETEPNRAQRNETAVRWFLVALLDPADRRAVLERELEHADAYAAMLREISERIGADRRPPVRSDGRPRAAHDDGHARLAARAARRRGGLKTHSGGATRPPHFQHYGR